MKRNCVASHVPTLSELRRFRQTGKIEVQKSATVRLTDRNTGEVHGYGTVERVRPEEIAKSVNADPNDCFDNLSIFDGLQEAPEIVEKAASFSDGQDQLFANTFPTCLQPS